MFGIKERTMKKIAVIFANGTEEIEALTPVDVLRRAGVEVEIVSVSGKTPVGSHNIQIVTDKLVGEVDFSSYDGIVIPGGMPGAINIANDDAVVDALEEMISDNKLVASICASPAVVLAKHDLLNGKKATCYPAPEFIKALGHSYTGLDVEVDGNLVTANGPKSAMKFALQICDYLGLTPKF